MFKYKNFWSVQQYGNFLAQSSNKYWFTPSCSTSDWVKKLKPAVPISFKEVEELSPKHKFLKQFKSRKGISAEVMGAVDIHLSWKELFTAEGFKEYMKKVKLRGDLLAQRYIDDRVDLLGPDLAAAHFIVHREGKVRFKGHEEWTQRNEDFEYSLPKLYDVNYLVEEIDVSEMSIMYDGLQNMENLKFLKTFKACKCPNFNDWCMDRISYQFENTLEELDISHCPKITGKGLEVIAKFKKLKLLKLHGLEHIENAKLICLLIEECLPGIKIEGVTI
ncbi:UNVERIFIED_CONTAM: hypothetical protein RMT77_013096 [Armadillidium vulgare]